MTVAVKTYVGQASDKTKRASFLQVNFHFYIIYEFLISNFQLLRSLVENLRVAVFRNLFGS